MVHWMVALALAAAVALGAPARAQEEPAQASPAPTGETLSADEVTALFTGNTERNEVMKRGAPTGRLYHAFYKPDGTYLMQERNGYQHGGVWFVDPLGRLCFRPGGKDKTKCDVIVKEGDHYIRLRDGGLRGRFTVAQGDTQAMGR